MSNERVWKSFRLVRRVTVFLLGAWIIAAALVDPDSENTVSLLIIGAIMMGALPLEDLLPWRSARWPDDRRRIRERDPEVDP